MSSLIAHLKRSPISHLLMTITFFTSGIILNILQGCLYYFLRPVWKYAYRKLNYYLCYSLYSQLVFMAEWWSGSDVIVYVDKEDFKKYFGKEHGYLIMNHTYDVDWLIGWIFCERVGVLGKRGIENIGNLGMGMLSAIVTKSVLSSAFNLPVHVSNTNLIKNCKAYAKRSIQYVPTMGWAWKFSESVFLERNFDKDKEIIGRQVAEIAQYPDPMFLLLFAEGTRFSEDKHKASLNFAKEKGLPLLQHHLTPRTKGFTASLPHLRGRVPAIYNIQLCFDNNDYVKPTVMNLLLGKPIVGHMHFERIPVENVPEDEEEAAQWLRDLYNKKDRMMDSFLKTGDFFSTSGVPRVEGIRLPRRLYSLINMTVWAFFTLIPMVYCLTCLLTSGSTLYVTIGLFIISVFFLMLYKLIEQTKIDKGSSYGKITQTSPTSHENGSNLNQH